MQTAVVFAFLAVAVGAQDKYPTTLDTVDIDAILSNERAIDGFFKCFMDTGPCSPEGDRVKKKLPEILQTDCAKCSDKQKENLSKVFKYLFNPKGHKYPELVAKYDPEGKYTKKYRDGLAA